MVVVVVAAAVVVVLLLVLIIVIVVLLILVRICEHLIFIIQTYQRVSTCKRIIRKYVQKCV